MKVFITLLCCWGSLVCGRSIEQEALEYAKRYPNQGPIPDPRLSPDLLFGDIVVPEGDDYDPMLELEEPILLSAVFRKNRTWPDGVLYYDIQEDDYSDEQVFEIKAAMLAIEQSTAVDGESCIQMVRVDRNDIDNGDFVLVRDDGRCSSVIGRAGVGLQPLSLGQGCVYHGVIQHEFLHALGMFHEQNRGDRDDYVIINWDNIQTGYETMFIKREDGVTIDHLGTEYDYGSVMHYTAYSFADDPSIPTIIPKDPDVEIGKATEMSDVDIERIQLLYGCIEPEKSKHFKHLKDFQLFEDAE